MAEEKTAKKSSYADLLKYPVIVFSVLLALILARLTLGITFGPISEISGKGVKFSQSEKAEFAELSSKLNGALAAIDELEKRLEATSDEDSENSKAIIFEASQTVSDRTAKIARLSATDMNQDSQTGFIWIGDYKDNWERGRLASIETGQPISLAPNQLLPGTEYNVLGNMVVREGLPPNDKKYYRGVKSLGIIPRGDKIRLVGAPIGIDRKFSVQYWVEIELP